MTLDDIKKKIGFWTTLPKEPHYYRKRCAGWNITAEVTLGNYGHPPMEKIDKILAHRVLSMLYDDRRREVRTLLTDLYMINPFEGIRWHDKIRELEKALGYGPPI